MRNPTLRQIKTMLSGSRKLEERTPLLEEESPCSSSKENIRKMEPFCESTAFGAILISLSAVSYGLSASAVSMGRDIATPVVVGARFLGAFIFTTIGCVLGRVNVFDLDRASVRVLVGRSIFGFASFVCGTYAFQNMPVGEATVLVSMAPVFVALLSTCFLGERMSCMGGFLILLSLGGVVLVVDPGTLYKSGTFPTNTNYLAGCAAVAQALNKALSYIFIKRSNNRIYFMTMIFWYSMFGTTLSILFVVLVYFPLSAAGKDASWVFSKLDGKDVLLLAVISILGFLSQLTLTKATQMINTTIASLIRNTDIIVTMIFQIFFFHIIPCWVQIIGMIVMVTATLSLLLMKEYTRRHGRTHPTQVEPCCCS